MNLQSLIKWPLTAAMNLALVLGNRLLDVESSDLLAWPDDEAGVLDSDETPEQRGPA